MAALIGGAARDLGRLFARGTGAGLGEGELLERFVERGDHASLGALVERHGPMVLAVCRGILPDPNDAADAFQATFLVLVRRASGLKRRDELGSWLHGVALRVARRSRWDSARRRDREARFALARPEEDSVEPSSHEVEAADLRRALHDEIARLPERYRKVVVLCHLEGRSQEEAARLLGRPIGTVKGWLARARDLLRARLSRRGFAAGATGIAGLLASPFEAAASPGLVATTITTALGLTGRTLVGAAASSGAVRLMQGAIQTMWITRMKLVGTVVAALGFGASGAAYVEIAAQDEAAADAKAARAPKPEAAPKPRPSPDTRPYFNLVSNRAYEVLGSVAAPGAYPFNGRDTVLDALFHAGGLLPDSLPADIRIVRENKFEGSKEQPHLTLSVDLDAILRRGDSTTNYQLKPGDRLFVQRSLKNWATWAFPSFDSKDWANVAPNRNWLLTGDPLNQPMGDGIKPNPVNSRYFRDVPGSRSANINPADAKATEAVRKQLDVRVRFDFGKGVSLSEFINEMKSRIKDEQGKSIPIYVDPIALKESGHTMSSPIVGQIDDIPFRTALKLILAQLELSYDIVDGVIVIGRN